MWYALCVTSIPPSRRCYQKPHMYHSRRSCFYGEEVKTGWGGLRRDTPLRALVSSQEKGSMTDAGPSAESTASPSLFVEPPSEEKSQETLEQEAVMRYRPLAVPSTFEERCFDRLVRRNSRCLAFASHPPPFPTPLMLRRPYAFYFLSSLPAVGGLRVPSFRRQCARA